MWPSVCSATGRLLWNGVARAGGLTREELAEKAGIHRTYLSDVGRGTRNPSLVNIERLVAALAVSLANLFAAVDGG